MKLVTKGFLILLAILLSLNTPALAQSASSESTGKSQTNINTAGQAELERLPGIGPSLAKKILEFRQKNGNFKNPSDLVAVQGIGEKKYEAIKHMITVK